MSYEKLLRFPTIRALTGLSRTTIWRLEQEKKFPARRQISTRAVGWNEAEVTRWLQGRSKVQ